MPGPQFACFAITKVQMLTRVAYRWLVRRLLALPVQKYKSVQLCTFVLASPCSAGTKVQRVQMTGHQFAGSAITTVQVGTSVFVLEILVYEAFS
jgi:hypothetical protein